MLFVRMIRTIVCLFVCLFNSYTVPPSRESMREIIYSDVPCHLCTIQARRWWSSKFQIAEDDFSDWPSSHIVEDDLIQIVICNRFTFVLMFRFWFAFALSRSYHLCRLQNDQVFCQMISKRSSFLRSNFLNFVSRLKFLFRTQLVHAKTTLSCDRRYYKRRVDDRWKWSTNDVIVWSSLSKRKCFHFFRFQYMFSSNSKWSSFSACLAEVTVRHARELFIVKKFMHSWECSVSYYQSFFINVSFEKSTSSSLAWTSLRCLNCNSSSVARRYLNTLTISSKMFKNIIKFVSRLSAHIFFRSSSNSEHFSSVWCIVCLRASHEHLENSIASILWR